MTNLSAIIEQVFREQHGWVLSVLISQLGDFELAEDALQDALVAAVESWGRDGIPRNPTAWLTSIAKRRAIDRLRRKSNLARKYEVILHSLQADSLVSELEQENDEVDMDEPIPDERLKLMFTCCHPALSLDARVALTLRTLGGLTTTEIARAFLVPLATMAQRLTRAQNKIRDSGIPYRIPPANLLPERLDALLAVIYLIFNEGYAASSGDVLIRHDLCSEAIRLARVVVALLPENEDGTAEAQGILALMLLHDSRRAARVNEAGELILLEDQDRRKWDRGQIAEGTAILQAALQKRQPGPYQVQAAISALHAEAKTAQDTDWAQISELYGALVVMTPSPVIEVNRAVAIAMSDGAQAGLRMLYHLRGTLDTYYPFHVAMADLLRRTNQREAAADAYARALELCGNALERAYLEKRLREMGG
jgi:RNA polymerase sigma-70 factor (ECF subfamily)